MQTHCLQCTDLRSLFSVSIALTSTCTDFPRHATQLVHASFHWAITLWLHSSSSSVSASSLTLPSFLSFILASHLTEHLLTFAFTDSLHSQLKLPLVDRRHFSVTQLSFNSKTHPSTGPLALPQYSLMCNHAHCLSAFFSLLHSLTCLLPHPT